MTVFTEYEVKNHPTKSCTFYVSQEYSLTGYKVCHIQSLWSLTLGLDLTQSGLVFKKS